MSKPVILAFSALIYFFACSHLSLANEQTLPQRLYVPTSDGGRWGLVDESGGLIAAPIYRRIFGFRSVENGRVIALVQSEEKLYGYIDGMGNTVHPPSFNDARSFTDMFVARVKKGDKWGFIDGHGVVFIKPEYDSVSPMENGTAVVQTGKKYFFVGKDGEQIIDKTFADLENFSVNGVAAYRKKERGLWGLIDRSGKLVSKPRFMRVGEFNANNRAPAAVDIDDDWHWGVIDEKGSWVVKPKYASLERQFWGGLTVATDRNFKNRVIDDNGKALMERSSNNIKLSQDCQQFWSGYDSRTFYDWRGKKIESLNKPWSVWFSGYNAHCTGVAFDGQRWGRLEATGSFQPFPESIVEPYTDDYANVVGWRDAFMPALTQDRKLVYVNQKGDVAFTTGVQRGLKKDVFQLQTVQGDVLWNTELAAQTLKENHTYLFNPADREVGFNPEWAVNIDALLGKLKTSAPKYFNTLQESAYDVSSDEFSDSAFGTSEILAFHYLSEEVYGSYHFMGDEVGFSNRFALIKKQLVASLGKSKKLTETLLEQIYQHNLHGGDYRASDKTIAAWEINNSLLVLTDSAWYGDGDATSALALSLVSPEPEKSNAQTLNFNSEEHVETQDESDDDVHEAVVALSQNTSSARVTRELAKQVFGLIEGGSDISEYDYLWTLYGLISSAYPELDGGLSRKEYIDVADTAMSYLEANGVGQWVFTEPGKFMMEVYRRAGNGVAWELRESDPQTAKSYIEAALAYARDEDKWLHDTHVRILLNLGEQDKAYATVKAVLDEDPSFADFQDFLSNQDYLNWVRSN